MGLIYGDIPGNINIYISKIGRHSYPERLTIITVNTIYTWHELVICIWISGYGKTQINGRYKSTSNM